jgi:hypothetical protein
VPDDDPDEQGPTAHQDDALVNLEARLARIEAWAAAFPLPALPTAGPTDGPDLGDTVYGPSHTCSRCGRPYLLGPNVGNRTVGDPCPWCGYRDTVPSEEPP